MKLNPKSRQALKGQAHGLKPIIIIGNQGFTPAVEKEMDRALLDHELIKVRINANDRDERKAMVEVMCAKTNSQLVQTIGAIGVFYRKNKDEKK